MRVLIVEDEAVVARRLERLLRSEAGGDGLHVTSCRTRVEAARWLADHPVDVVFLDLDLNGEDGFELVEDAAAGPFHTVVVSGHTERALEAFEVGVLDFVPKPFGAERIRRTLERLRGARGEHAAARLAVRSPGRLEFVPVAGIAFVRAAGASSELVLRDGSVTLHGKSIEQLLAVLPASFERVHRSYLVRLDEVRRLRVRKGSRYSVELESGAEIPVGRTRVEALRERLEEG